MTTLALSAACAALAAACLALLWDRRRGGRGKGPETRAYLSVEELRAIGVLSVFKAVTKEIVTASDHSLGRFGKKYLEWFVTSKKMAMIFEFDIDFQYDLRDPRFSVESLGEGAYAMTLPPCGNVVNVRGVTFYDEQGGKLLPILLPDVVNRLLGGNFSEEDRNRLMEEARAQAGGFADKLAKRLSGEVQASARQTMEMLGRSFGAKRVEVRFAEEKAADAVGAAG
ncbi:MAG: DUF4230 domain-containing protein [Kiritimatiellae bacterium]|nr:DUF4230 domain-containing protein [Kiritimatiellia bacterium]